MARGAHQRRLTNPPRETIRFFRRHPLRLLEVAAVAAGVWVVCWLLAHLTPLHWLAMPGYRWLAARPARGPSSA